MEGIEWKFVHYPAVLHGGGHSGWAGLEPKGLQIQLLTWHQVLLLHQARVFFHEKNP